MCFSGDHHQCAGLQEGGGAVARGPHGEWSSAPCPDSRLGLGGDGSSPFRDCSSPGRLMNNASCEPGRN